MDRSGYSMTRQRGMRYLNQLTGWFRSNSIIEIRFTTFFLFPTRFIHLSEGWKQLLSCFTSIVNPVRALAIFPLLWGDLNMPFSIFLYLILFFALMQNVLWNSNKDGKSRRKTSGCKTEMDWNPTCRNRSSGWGDHQDWDRSTWYPIRHVHSIST